MNQLPLSPYSMLFWNEFVRRPDSADYNISISQQLSGQFDADRFESSLTRFLDDHIIFDSHLSLRDGQPFWTRNKRRNTLQKIANDKELDEFIKKPFDLLSAPLYRIALQTLSAEKVIFTIVFHHLIMDGRIQREFFDKISSYYNGADIIKAVTAEQIADKVMQAKERVASLDTEDTLLHWKALTPRLPEAITLPFASEKKNAAASHDIVDEIRFSLSKTDFNNKRKISQRPFIVFSQVWGTLLARCSAQRAVALFYPIAIRQLSGLEMGAQVNSSVMLVEVLADTTLRNLCQRENRFSLMKNKEGVYYNYLPTDNIVALSGCTDLRFSFAQTPQREYLFAFEGCQAQPVHGQYYDLAGADLSLEYEETEQHFNFRLRYRRALFDPSTVSRCGEYFLHLLMSAIQQPDAPLLSLPLLSDEEICRLTAPSDHPVKTFRSLAEQFELQVTQRPNMPAVSGAGCPLSYLQLNHCANVLAHQLRQRGLHPDIPVALHCEKGREFVVAMLAIIKAGGSYMPVDIAAPAARKQYQLEQAAVQIMISQAHFVTGNGALTAGCKHPVDILLCDVEELLSMPARDNPRIPCHDDPTAAIFFTSGTTGNPKGVIVTQQAIAGLVQETNYVSLSPQDTLLFLASPSFDAATFEVWGALLNGARLIIPATSQQLVSDPKGFKRLLMDEQVSALFVTRTLFDTLYLIDNHIFDSVRQLMVGGEALTPDIMQAIVCQSPRPEKVLNAYGPTECTTFSCWYEILPDREQKSIPIGKAVTGRILYVLNDQLQLQPDGAQGELYIGGHGLAKGYLGDPALTERKFIPDPFGNGRLYKTGDQVTRLADGNLVYHGRHDTQVKIRGYRIDLSEIEGALLLSAGVQQAAVLNIVEPENHYLVAWYVCKTDSAVTPDVLRENLLALLPEYMIPAIFHLIDEIPVNINGKLDRKALLATHQGRAGDVVQTSTLWEALVLKEWLRLLPVASVGLDDNFYRVGGDSVQAILLVAALRKQGHALSLYEINQHPTVRAMAQLLQSRSVRDNGGAEGVHKPMRGPVPLLPVQQWFFRQRYPQPQHFNQAFTLRLPEDVSDLMLQEAINALVGQHGMLRASFPQSTPYVHDVDDYPCQTLLTLHPGSITELTQQLTQLQSDFDLERGPLWRAAIIRQHPAGGDVLWFAFHHLVIDMFSWRILAQDIEHFLQHKSLPSPSSSYQQWADSLAGYAESWPDDVLWWRNALRNLPASSLVATKSDLKIEVILSSTQTEQLLGAANEAWGTEINDLLLSALALALQAISGQRQHCILMEGRGREAWQDTMDFSRTIGCFTSLYPLVLTAETTLAETIIGTKEGLRQIPAKGVGFGILHQRNQLADITLPAISFNYLGQLTLTSEKPWTLSYKNTGEWIHSANASSQMLTINGVVDRGQLSFIIESQLSSEQTEAFAQALHNALAEIAELAVPALANHSGKTASDYGTQPLAQDEIVRLRARYPQMKALYTATPLQQGMLFNALRSPDDDAYHVQQLMHYHCALDITCYKKAWVLAVQMYPILRTAFDWQGENILQIEMNSATLTTQWLKVVDLSDCSESEQQAEITRLQQQDRLQRFDLSQPALFRLLIVKCQQEEFYLLKSEHHAICDGWSMTLLFEQVHRFYDLLIKGEQPEIIEQQSWPQALQWLQRRKSITAEFWQQQKQRFATPNNLQVLARPETDKACPPAAFVQHILTPTEFGAFKQLLVENGYTLNTVLQFAWHKLMQIYTQDAQTQAGLVVSGRGMPLAEIENCVGPFINTLPLTVDWASDHSCAHVLTAIQQTVVDFNSHSNISLSALQDEGISLFQSLVVCENYPQSRDKDGIAAASTLLKVYGKLDYPLVLMAYELNSGLTLQLDYHTDWLSAAHASTLLASVLKLMTQALQNVSCVHTQLWLEEEAPQAPLLPSVCTSSLATRFDWCVQQYATSTALSWGNTSLNYQQLDQRASYLASVITGQLGELKPDTPIALLMDKSADFVIAMLAIVKAGGCYVPLSTEYPAERISWMLDDTAAPLVLTQADHLALVKKYNALCVDTLIPQACKSVNASADAESLGAIIYTSGTTGTPKGVLIEQAAMVELVVDNPSLPLTEEDSLLFLSSPVFDAATFEIWGALLNGGKLVIPELSTQDLASDTRAFRSLMQHQRVSVMWVTRALFDNLWKRDNHLFDSLSYLLVGGEALTPEIMLALANQSPRPQHIINGYGPTECTTFTTTAEIFATDTSGSLPIGRAIAGRQLYVLDSHMQPVPQGAIGELYVGGRGLARGYLNRPDLTAKQFVTSPRISGRLYKTGDQVRIRPDGQLEYLGRKDQQVKIRGYRVELQEIEAVLNQQPGVQQSVVLLQDTGGAPQLCAWYVPHPSEETSVPALFIALESRLPDYMLPASIIPIAEIPLTINGKLARERLPQATQAREVHYQAPVTSLEKTITAVWQQILKTEQISVTDNFFRIGGDSIQSILVTTALRKQGIHCTTRDIFNAKSVQQLARLLESNVQSETLSEQGVLTGPCPLLPVQQWFFAQQLIQPNWFNQAFTLSLPAGTDTEILRASLHKLIAHHDLLRARYKVRKGYAEQSYSSVTDDIPFSVFDTAACATASELTQNLTHWQSDFCLSEGPLFRFVMLHDSRTDAPPSLFCAFHHLIIDAVSWRILADDLQTLCEGRKLGNKGTSYRQWAQKLRDYANTIPLQQRYWDQVIAGQPDYRRMLTAKTTNSSRIARSLMLTQTKTRALLTQVHDAYKTEINDLLLTPLAYALSSWHGGNESFITLEGHGREAITSDVEINRTVGWFTVMYPVKLKLSASPAATLRHVKDTLRQVPDKGLGYSALKYSEQATALKHHDLPAISFNYLGQFTTEEGSGSWQIDQTKCGETVAAENGSSNVLDVTGRVTGGQLTLIFSALLPEEALDKLVDEYQQQLLALITHCQEVQAAGESWFSPADFPHCALTLQELDRLQRLHRLDNAYPVTPTQREQLYFNRINSDYQIDQSMVVIEGDFDPEIMRQSWQYAAQRYDVFRTGYSDRACPGEPVAFICRQTAIPVVIEDWRELPRQNLPEALEQRLLEDRLKPFNPEQPPLIRVVIIIGPDNKHYMMQTFNHVLIDGWSNSNIITTLIKDYRALQTQQAVNVTPSGFEPFITWLRGTDHSAAETFWSTYLAGAPMNQRLPVEKLPPVQLQQEKRMRQIQYKMRDTLTASLYRFASKTGYTVNQLTQLAWMKALAAHIPGDDIVIGTTMSERPAGIEQVDRLAGMFVASPVLRLQGIHSRSNEALLAEIASSQPDRQQYAFHELNHYDDAWRPTSPFGSLLVFESMPAPEIGDDVPFTLQPYGGSSGSNHQTVICLLPDAKHFGFIVFYDCREVGDETIQAVAKRFIAELENLCLTPNVVMEGAED